MDSFEVVTNDWIVRSFGELHLHRISFVHFFLERRINILVVQLVLKLPLTFSLVYLLHAWDQLLLRVEVLINRLHHTNSLLFSTGLTIDFNCNSIWNISILFLHNRVDYFTSSLRRVGVIVLNTRLSTFIFWWAVVINWLHETLVEYTVASSPSSHKLTRFQFVVLILNFLNVLLSLDALLSQLWNLIFKL